MDSKFSRNILKYNVESNTLFFWCSGIDESKEATFALNSFLFDLSNGRNVFLSAYRLPDEREIIEPTEILEKAEVKKDPFHVFLHLSHAKVNSNKFDWASELAIYYFDKSVLWADFLSISSGISSEQPMKDGLLFAQFLSIDQGADFWFKCTALYEPKVRQLFDCMSRAGWEVKHANGLEFPLLVF